MDTLDYTGPMLNEGSKGVLLGMGEIRRELPKEFNASLPTGITCAKVFCPGCLVISGQGISAEEISTNSSFRNWPLVILADSAADSVSSTAKFLWTVFTRFEPAADIYANRTTLNRFHPSLEPPILIDARMKANYPAELFCDEQTKTLVDTRWKHYRI
jgi:3-polyprenyl-4-hydroxybenzoate decarboxylase